MGIALILWRHTKINMNVKSSPLAEKITQHDKYWTENFCYTILCEEVM